MTAMAKEDEMLKNIDSYYFLGSSGILALFLSFSILFLIPNNFIRMTELIVAIFFIESLVMGAAAFLAFNKCISHEMGARIGIALAAEIAIAMLLLQPFSPEIWISKGLPVTAALYISMASSMLGMLYSMEKLAREWHNKTALTLMILNAMVLVVSILLFLSLKF